MIATATFNTGAMADAADDPLAGATDLAEYLVRSGVAFRDAHAVVGTLVREALSTGLSLIDLTRDHDQLGPEAAALLQPGRAVHNRITPGGAGLVPLQDQLARFEAHLAANRATVESL